MTQLTTLDVRNLIASYLPSDASLIKSNSIDRNKQTSIGVFQAPESRWSKIGTYGGMSAEAVSFFPANILVRWTEDSDACEKKADEIYKKLNTVGQNFFVNLSDSARIKIAFIKMLDSAPVWLGRGEGNVCEYSIRVDIYFYKNN